MYNQLDSGERLAVLETELEFYRQQCGDHEKYIGWLRSRIAWICGFGTAVTIAWPFVAHKIGEAIGLFQK